MATNNKNLAKNISKTFGSIRKLVTGTDNPDFDSHIDKLSKSIAKFSNNKTRNVFSDLLKSLYKTNDNGQLDVKDLMRDLGLDAIKPESDRTSRYGEYKEIIQKIPYAKRALEVIRDNIISPDDYLVSSFRIKPKNSSDIEEYDDVIRLFELLVDKFEIEDKLRDMLDSTLYLGDYFCEIIDADYEFKNSVLTEDGNRVDNIIKNRVIIEQKDGENFDINIDFKIVDPLVNLRLTEDHHVDNIKDITDKIKHKITTTFINFYDPSTVVRLGDKVCIGYLVFPKSVSKIGAFTNLDLSQQDIEGIFGKLLKRVKIKKDDVLKNDDLKTLVSKLIVYTRDFDGSQNEPVRFVPETNMVHFKIDSIENAPYGRSIFFGQEFLAKLIILIETTIAIMRITAATEKRVIAVELGLPRDARNLIEEMKRQFKRKKYSVDDIGTIKEVPSVISTFENIYLPMKDGKRFVEFDSMSPVGNVNDKVDDLKELRDQFVAGLNVPPPYLGLEENIESKSTLSHENLIFARSIVSYQRLFSKYLTELLRKLYVAVMGENNDEIYDISVAFSPPKSLKLEMNNEYYQNLSSLIQTLQELGISKEYIINEYLLGDLPPQEIEKMKIRDKIEKTFANDEEDQSGGGF
jgi:hypothetical protein